MLWMLPFKRYFEFSGRSGRAEYWQFIAAVLLLYLAAAIVGYIGGGSPTPALLAMLGCTIPVYAVTFRRLHDRNISGWYVGALWVLNGIYFSVSTMRGSFQGSVVDIPFMIINGLDLTATTILAIHLLVQICMRGDDEENRFGSPPEQPNSADSSVQANFASFLGGARETLSQRQQPDRLDQLERLARLRREGVLSDVEFERQKLEILGENKP